MELSKKIIQLYLIAVAALFTAAIFSTEIVGNKNLSDWMVIKNRTAISCGSYDPISMIYPQPFQKESGDKNSCPHQLAAPGLLSINGSKKNKIHLC